MIVEYLVYDWFQGVSSGNKTGFVVFKKHLLLYRSKLYPFNQIFVAELLKKVISFTLFYCVKQEGLRGVRNGNRIWIVEGCTKNKDYNFWLKPIPVSPFLEWAKAQSYWFRLPRIVSIDSSFRGIVRTILQNSSYNASKVEEKRIVILLAFVKSRLSLYFWFVNSPGLFWSRNINFNS